MPKPPYFKHSQLAEEVIAFEVEHGRGEADLARPSPAPGRAGKRRVGAARRMPLRAQVVGMLGVLCSLLACTPAAVRVDRQAAELGLTRRIVQGEGFAHVVYEKAGGTRASALHVYLEGDGTPWIRERWIATDPTPRNPLMLRLMALDPGERVYLGRPCYHGLAAMPSCTPELWTFGRYSAPVVDSMVTAVRKLLAERGNPALYLFGHSGGGTLAMLLAERLANTRAVVTLAGNLDIEAWARHHHYTPLVGSLNPAHRPPLAPTVQQLHLVGTDDRLIPPALADGAVARRANSRVVTIKDFTHTCCWEAVWPAVLEWVRSPTDAPSLLRPLSEGRSAFSEESLVHPGKAQGWIH